MKIAIAQIKPYKGDIQKNIEKHLLFIENASSAESDAIFFTELSLTGYEPELANDLATTPSDARLDCFQEVSDLTKIAIGVGLPTRSSHGILISMVIFQPFKARQIYSKQLLHSDELPFFKCGSEQIILSIENTRIAPAICYESLQDEHIKNVSKFGADVYLASVAKPQRGVEKAYKHYPKIAEEFSVHVLMANATGHCDNFESAGQSSIWDNNGRQVLSLNASEEGILVFDTETQDAGQILFK